jgi:hypothetical protein
VWWQGRNEVTGGQFYTSWLSSRGKRRGEWGTPRRWRPRREKKGLVCRVRSFFGSGVRSGPVARRGDGAGLRKLENPSRINAVRLIPGDDGRETIGRGRTGGGLGAESFETHEERRRRAESDADPRHKIYAVDLPLPLPVAAISPGRADPPTGMDRPLSHESMGSGLSWLVAVEG